MFMFVKGEGNWNESHMHAFQKEKQNKNKKTHLSLLIAYIKFWILKFDFQNEKNKSDCEKNPDLIQNEVLFFYPKNKDHFSFITMS